MSRGIKNVAKRLQHLDAACKSFPTITITEFVRGRLWEIIDLLGSNVDYHIAYIQDGGIRVSFKINSDGTLD